MPKAWLEVPKAPQVPKSMKSGLGPLKSILRLLRLGLKPLRPGLRPLKPSLRPLRPSLRPTTHEACLETSKVWLEVPQDLAWGLQGLA